MKDLVTHIGTSVATSIDVRSRDLVVDLIGHEVKAKWLVYSTNFLNEGKGEGT